MNTYDLDLSEIKSSDHNRLVGNIESFYSADTTMKAKLAYH